MSCTVCMYVHTTVHVPGKTKTCTRYVPHVCTIKRFTCRSNMGMSNLHMCTCMYCTPLMTCTCTCTSTSTSTSTSTRYSTCHQVFEEATKPTKKRASTAQSESRLRTVLAPIHCTKSRNGKKEIWIHLLLCFAFFQPFSLSLLFKVIRQLLPQIFSLLNSNVSFFLFVVMMNA